ncbi:hypothetical protein ScalyP_jg4415 [Parmales sp. scaly parma]|jgi:hypothetical protein|nr:hypothetical protein ScalyP_jg4415 [Parmales sp. scaly parma]|tara:strand:- start:456 stop:1211 length:756 start_codon:yes stop_codon:yes gene_type:complete
MATDPDDLPIAQLKKKPSPKKKATPAKVKPAQAKKAKKEKEEPARAKRAVRAKKAPLPESDSDDEPLSAMKKKPLPKSKPAADKKSPVKKPSSSAKTIQRCVTNSSTMYNETNKGKLVQHILCRWWYAMSWPARECLTYNEPGYDPVDAFPGVFIAVSGSDIGHIVDRRNKKDMPCFDVMIKKSSSDLKDLLLDAIDGQKEAMKESTSVDSTEFEVVKKDLDTLQVWCKNVIADKADREAETIAKKHNLKL